MAKADSLPRGEPESQGVDSRAILDFLEAVDAEVDSLHGFMLLRHGVVVAEGAWKPFRLESPHMLFSLSKSFASTAVGLAVTEGRLSVEDPVLSFFPKRSPEAPSANLRAMKVRHLLSMNTGHEADTTDRIMGTRDPAKAFLALPVEREPGSHFVYNSGASFMLSAIVQELTGKRLSDYLRPRLFEPLGIEGARWERHRCGVEFGGWGLNIKVEDIARFGQFLLEKGERAGSRILPSAWIDEASSVHSVNASGDKPDPSSDWQQGYGYQFWRCRHGAYRGDGAFGQYCLVLPEQDAVLAVVAGVSDLQRPLDLVWDRLLPAFRGENLPPAPEAARALSSFASSLWLRPPSAAQRAMAPGASPAAVPITAPSARKEYSFGDNWAGLRDLSFDFRADRLELGYRVAPGGPMVRRGSGRRSLRCGYGQWEDCVSYLEGEGPRQASCSGAWTGPDTFTMRHFARETPFVTTLAFRFQGDSLRVEGKRNVGFGPTEFPAIESLA